MGIRFICPHCNRRLNVKSFLAGKRGFCPKCRGRIVIPYESSIPVSQPTAATAVVAAGGESRSDNASGQGTSLDLAYAAPRAEAPPVVGSTNQAGAEPTLPPSAPEVTSPFPADQPGMAATGASPSIQAGQSGTAATTASPVFAAAAALSEAPQAVWFVRSLQGQQFGPASAEQMEIWLKEGRIWPTMYVWREGWATWKLASEVFSPDTWHTARVHTTLPGSNAPPLEGATVTRALVQYQRRKQSQQWWWVVSVVVLTILAVVLTVALVIVLRR